MYNTQKLLGTLILSKVASLAKKRPVKVTCTTFREVERLTVYSFYLISLYEKISDDCLLVGIIGDYYLLVR